MVNEKQTMQRRKRLKVEGNFNSGPGLHKLVFKQYENKNRTRRRLGAPMSITPVEQK